MVGGPGPGSQSLTAIAQRNGSGTVVLVGHDAVNREVLVALDAGLSEPDALHSTTGASTCWSGEAMNGPF
jgi:broad specificity phosphatase PhoE